ncbi:MAG: glycosyltransferase family 39 protein, partial [Elusimicrobia bacterium]|nr:glycosyltransferase family 39 protein [Elusimicrobiota bacterium]
MDWKWPALLVLALGCRLGYVLLSHEGQSPPAGDAQVYYDMARNVAHGEGLRYGTAYALRPPAYPLFLAATQKLVGDSYFRVQLVQVLLALLTIVLLHRLTRLRYEEKVAWLACLIYAVSYDSFAIPATFLSENLFSCLIVLSLYCLLTDRPLWAAAALSATYFTRQESLLFIAFVVAAYAASSLKANWRRIFAIVALLAALNAAWVWRNYRIHHALLGGTSLSECHLFLSNAYIFQRLGYAGEIGGRILTQPDAGMTELEMIRTNKRACSELFQAQPWHRFLLAPFLKAGFFLYPFLPEYDVTYMLVLPFWLLGLYLERGRWRENQLFYGVFAILGGLLLFFHAQPRYRGSFYAFIAIFAAAGAVRLWSAGTRARLAMLGWGLL